MGNGRRQENNPTITPGLLGVYPEYTTDSGGALPQRGSPLGVHGESMGPQKESMGPQKESISIHADDCRVGAG